MANTDQLITKLAIQQLTQDYVYFVDKQDFENFANIFAVDAIYLPGPAEPLHGREAILAFLKGLPEDFPFVKHHVSSHKIEIHGPDRASGLQYFQAISGIGLDSWGVYKDEYRLVDGEWLFQSRGAIIEGVPPNSIMFPAEG